MLSRISSSTFISLSARRALIVCALACAVCLASCATKPASNNSAGAAPASSSSAPSARPTIVFMTDFGTANDAVALCKAVMIGIAPDARIMDITHQVTPFSIPEAARFLEAVSPYYPAGTVFVAVIDPGVGPIAKPSSSKRKKASISSFPTTA